MNIDVRQKRKEKQELKVHQQYNYRGIVDCQSHFVFDGCNSGVVSGRNHNYRAAAGANNGGTDGDDNGGCRDGEDASLFLQTLSLVSANTIMEGTSAAERTCTRKKSCLERRHRSPIRQKVYHHQHQILHRKYLHDLLLVHHHQLQTQYEVV